MPALVYTQCDLSFEDIVTYQCEQSAEQYYNEHRTSWLPPQYKFRREQLADIIYYDMGIHRPAHSRMRMQSSNDE